MAVNRLDWKYASAIGSFVAATALAAAAGAAPRPARPHGSATRPAKPLSKKLKPYPTRYYVIYTDLAGDEVREAAARLTAMAEEYHRRTRDFAGVIRNRLPFGLFSSREDYYAAGGMKNTGGMYHPERQLLMAVADGGADAGLWHVVQHEGFHQFADLVIGGGLPTWVDEGLAEYFGQGIWTGDGFVTGLAPPRRTGRVKGYIRDGTLVPFTKMLMMTQEQWNQAVEADEAEADADAEPPDRTPEKATLHYDQAWSMVHFLVHGEEAKYRRAFARFIKDVSRGENWTEAFRSRFGRNIKAFEYRYRRWWLAREESPTWPLYVKAVVQTLTSFLGRAVSQGQKFATAEQFFRAARSRELAGDKAQWLPPMLLEEMLLHARKWKGWSLDSRGGSPKLVLGPMRGKTFTGTFTHSRGKVDNVKVEITDPKP